MTFIKRLILASIFLVSVSCDDGDFESLDFQFTDSISYCGNYLLYKTNKNGTETLALSLSERELGTTEGEKTYNIGGNIKVIYRVFDKAVGNSYFCQKIPPTTPKITKNLEADKGTKIVIKTAKKKDKYEYKITLNNLLFEDDNRFYFESFSFGTFSK